MSLFKKRNSRGTDDTIKNGAKLITVAKPKGPISEQFRTVRTNINFMAVDHDIKSLAFTSANISEGKSTVAANVAVTYAQAGRRVLLIDADLRRPTVHSTFDLSNRVGLSTIISSNAKEVDLDSVVQNSGVNNLFVLTAGPVPPNPSELIASNRMRDFVKLTEEHYDLIIIDLAPVLEVSDTQELASHLDGVALVVRQGRTQKMAIRRAVEMLKFAKVRILGYIMNDVDANNAGYGYGYGYGYGEEDTKKKGLFSRLRK